MEQEEANDIRNQTPIKRTNYKGMDTNEDMVISKQTADGNNNATIDEVLPMLLENLLANHKLYMRRN